MYQTRTRRIVVAAVCSLIAVGQTGCVSSSTYELARKDAENARLLYQNETRRAQELAATVVQLTAQIERTQAELKKAQEQIARTEQEFQATRDELLRLKIDWEQHQHALRKQLKVAQAHLQREQAVLDAEADLRSKTEGQSEETRRRVKALVVQIQTLLGQLEPF
ncbi:hypothetical protein [Nitrospira sp. Kam-Ns4a]